MTAEQPNVPVVAPAGEALVQQIAEAMEGPVFDPEMEPGYQHRLPTSLERARRVLPLVEAQVAPLRDEVERLRADGDRLDKVRVDLVRRAEMAESAAHFRIAQIKGARRRADAAESALRQVREDVAEVASWFDSHIESLHTVGEDDDCEWCQTPLDECEARTARRRLRAVLDSARVGAADTQPEGAGEAKCMSYGCQEKPIEPILCRTHWDEAIAEEDRRQSAKDGRS